MKTSVYRTLKGKKELVAKFKLTSDADLFAYTASNLATQVQGVVWTVEDANYIIKRYEATNDWL
jgi:hypothetical protein